MTKTTQDILGIIFLVAIALVMIALGPMVLLWSMNTLFPVLAIPYNFYTWAAAAFINASVYFRYKQPN
jgi:hypothetical protein